MLTDPIILLNTVQSILPANGGYVETSFPLVSSDIGQHVRRTIGSTGIVESLTTRLTTSKENDAVGYVTDRLNLRHDIVGVDLGLTTPVLLKGSCSITFSLPRGSSMIDVDMALTMLYRLIQVIATQVDDPTANTAMATSNVRLLRLLAGEG